MDGTVSHDQSHSRFSVASPQGTALLNYRQEGDTIYFVHTEVPAELEGQGVGGKLAQAALEYARTNQLKVVPRCPFVAGYIARHPEYADMVKS